LHLRGAIVEAAAHAGRVILLYVDIDRFHVVNETRGRAVGDEVLRMVAGRLIALCGGNGYVAHAAADEFAVVLVNVEGDQIEFAEAVRSDIERIICLGQQRIYLTCSIGVSCFPDNGSSPQELLRQSEAAMLRAKRDGRNTISAFSNEQKQALEDRSILGLRLSDAVRNDELILHYQPQVSGADGRVLGFEALVRWQSPEFGLLPPMRFLNVAEELGLIVDVGNFVLESVCQEARAWLDAGESDFSISINVSSLQLERPDFVDSIRAALCKFALPARHIELELTESMMVHNVERAIDTMKTLKALGVQLALDDFGTGYSSLNYLRRFPIDKLKIDQSFVQDIGSDAGAAGICRAIITLGHQLGMTVLAEGVETAAQVAYLRHNDCDQFQGFHFSRPTMAPQAFKLLQQRFVMNDAVLQQRNPRALPSPGFA
jgi:diguanylate cyclase (GGDEF)-like protein